LPSDYKLIQKFPTSIWC